MTIYWLLKALFGLINDHLIWEKSQEIYSREPCRSAHYS